MDNTNEAEKKAAGKARTIWLLPCYAFFLNLILGLIRSTGVLYVAIIEAEQFTRQEASWPNSVDGATAILFAPLAGMLTARWSPCQMTLCGVFLFVIGHGACYFSTNLYVLIIFYGAIRGCGMNIIMLIVPVVINTVFKQNRALAMGIAGSGLPVGGFIWPYLVQFLLDIYALKGTFLLIAGISLHGFIAALGLLAYNTHSKSYRDKREKMPDERTPILSKQTSSTYDSCAIRTEESQNDRETDQDDNTKVLPPSSPETEASTTEKNNSGFSDNIDPKSKTEKPPYFNPGIIKNICVCRGFYLLLVSNVVVINLISTFMQVNVDYMKDKGVSIADALHTVLIFSSGDLVGKLAFNWITDKNYLSRQSFTSVSLFLNGGGILLFTFTDSFPALLACSFVIGVCQSSIVSINNVMVADYMRRDEMALALSFIRSMNGLNSFGRAPVIGYFRDTLGSYDYLFLILGGSLFFASLMWLVEGLVLLRKKKYTQIKDTEGKAEENS